MTSLMTSLVCVVLLNVVAAVFVVLRGAIYRIRVYKPMMVNIGLSGIPLVVALAGVGGTLLLGEILNDLSSAAGPVVLWTWLIALPLVWLLFFPNSAYLITELNFSHRETDTPVPLWYDIVQTLTLTVSGLANAVASLAIMQLAYILFLLYPDDGSGIPLSSWIIASATIALGALGIYWGRYLRFNSWDVRHPRSMVRKLRAHFSTPGRKGEALGFVATHSILILLIYVPIFALTVEASGVL